MRNGSGEILKPIVTQAWKTNPYFMRVSWVLKVVPEEGFEPPTKGL